MPITEEERRKSNLDRARRYVDNQRALGRKATTYWITEEEKEQYFAPAYKRVLKKRNTAKRGA